MKRLAFFVIWGGVLVLMAGGCKATPTEVPPSPTAEVVQGTATAPVATQEATATSTPAGPTDTPTPKPLTGPRATAQALLTAVVIPTRTPTPTSVGGPEAASDYVAIFEKAWQIVKDNYVRDNFNGVDWDAVREAYLPKVEAVQSQEAFWDLMEAFIAELHDDHSRFIRPGRLDTEFELTPPEERTGRPAAGLIIWPAREDEQLMIWYVCEIGPAAQAGLQRGDVVLAINGQPVVRSEEGFDWPFIREALYGDHNAVTLTVQRGPDREPEEIRLRFGAVSGCDGWRYGLLSESPRIGYIRVPDFGGDADVNILQAIQLLEEEGPLDGLIVDIRHNPGGNADRSIAIFTSGVFGKVGPLRKDATQTIYRIRGPVRWNETTPVAVLIDGNSHSAAEYFATAMQQSGRAILVGMPTAGNTEGITGFSLPDGSLIRLAVSTIQLPDGSTLEGVGVQPDIRVPLGAWGLREVPDVQVQAAYKALTGQE